MFEVLSSGFGVMGSGFGVKSSEFGVRCSKFEMPQLGIPRRTLKIFDQTANQFLDRSRLLIVDSENVFLNVVLIKSYVKRRLNFGSGSVRIIEKAYETFI